MAAKVDKDRTDDLLHVEEREAKEKVEVK